MRIPLVIGTVFVGLANSGARPSHQIKGMAWCLLWATLATLIGGLAATLNMAQIPIAMVMARVPGQERNLNTRS